MKDYQFSDQFFEELKNKINVKNYPYPYSYIKNFLPIELSKVVSNDFKFPNKDPHAGIEDKVFQKTKKGLSQINLMPKSIKILIEKLNSREFLSVLEEKFNIKNLIADPTLFGGGMHESFKGGYLKIHSDFIFLLTSL